MMRRSRSVHPIITLAGASPSIAQIQPTNAANSNNIDVLPDSSSSTYTFTGGTARRYQFTLGSKPQDGHPLKPGSKVSELHKWCVANIDQGKIFHAGKLVSVMCVFANDWVTLRILLATAPLFSILFHFLFPIPRPARMFYGAFFCIGHLSALAWFLYSKNDYLWPIENPEFEKIYETSFQPYGVSKYEFRQFCGGEFNSEPIAIENCSSVSNAENNASAERTFKDRGPDGRLLARIEKYKNGDTVVHQGNDMKSIWLIVEGHGYFERKADASDKPMYDNAALSCAAGPLAHASSSAAPSLNLNCALTQAAIARQREAARDRMYEFACSAPQKLTNINSGSWVGEIFDKEYDWSKPHHWRVSFVCDTPEGCTVLRIPKKQFHDFVVANPHCENSCQAMQLKDLWRARRSAAIASVGFKIQLDELQNELNELKAQLHHAPGS